MSDHDPKPPARPKNMAVRIGPLMIIGGFLAIKGAERTNATITAVSREGDTGMAFLPYIGWCLLVAGILVTIVGLFRPSDS